MKRSDIQARAHELLESGHVECDFIEYKRSDRQKERILKTICAYANNYMNREIGLLYIGVQEEDGSSGLKAIPQRPIVGIEQGKLEPIENGLKELLGYIDPRPTCHFIPDMLDGVHYLIVAVEPSSRPSTTKDKALGKFGLRLGRNDEINDEINASGRENDEISYGIALTEDELLLVDTLAKQPHGTYAQFAQELGWSEAKVYRLAKSLREKGVIERTGSRKTGHWEVLGKLGEGTPHE